MNFICFKDDFIKALLVCKKSYNPDYPYIKIETLKNKEGIRIISSNFNKDIIFCMECNVFNYKEGYFFINIKRSPLLDVLKECPSESIYLEQNIQFIKIITEKYKCKLLIDSIDYPEIPDTSDIDFTIVDTQNFKKLLDTINATRLTREDLYDPASLRHRVYIDDNFEKFISVTTQSIYIYTLPLKQTAIKDIIISKKGLYELHRTLDKKLKTVKIGIKDDYFICKNGHQLFFIKLLHSWRFNYHEQILSFKEKQLVSEMDGSELLKILRKFKKEELITLTFRKGAISAEINTDFIEFKKEILLPDLSIPEEIKHTYLIDKLLEAFRVFEKSKINLSIKETGALQLKSQDNKLTVIVLRDKDK